MSCLGAERWDLAAALSVTVHCGPWQHAGTSLELRATSEQSGRGPCVCHH